jgi:hypothetical protein
MPVRFSPMLRMQPPYAQRMRRRCVSDLRYVHFGIDRASMEVTPLPIPGAEDWSEQFAVTLHAQRQRVREFLSTQQERLRRAEGELSEQLHQIAVELADDRRQTCQTREELTQRSEQLQQQAQVLEQMKTNLSARQAEWEILYRRVIEQQQSLADQLKQQNEEFARRQQDLLQEQSASVAAETQVLRERREIEAGRMEMESRRTELDIYQESLQKQQADVEKRQKEIETGWTELKSRRTELDALRDSLQSQQADLEQRQRELIAEVTEAEGARRRIAHGLRAKHAANLKEVELRRIELEQAVKADHSELQRQLALSQEECRILRNKPATAENSAGRREVEHIEAEKKELAIGLADLTEQLAEARQQLADAQASRDKEIDNDEDDSASSRYDEAVDELRELKALNEELQEQLALTRQSGSGNGNQITSGVLNWEAEKQRILAALEADFEETNAADHEEKLKIQDVIRKTDRVVAEKNREIGELRKLLESQSNNIGSMAVGAAALGQVLDTDALILEERKNLVRIQEECRDKLRQAEVEISLERAKIARERSQLEEKLRTLHEQGVDLAIADEKKESAKPARGRWLAQLGLTNTDNDQGK